MALRLTCMALLLNAVPMATCPPSNLMRQETSFSSDKEGEPAGAYVPHPGSHWLYVVELGFEPNTQRAPWFQGCIKPQGHTGLDAHPNRSHLPVHLCCKFGLQGGYSAHRDLKELGSSRMPQLANTGREQMAAQRGRRSQWKSSHVGKESPDSTLDLHLLSRGLSTSSMPQVSGHHHPWPWSFWVCMVGDLVTRQWTGVPSWERALSTTLKGID